MGFSDAIYALLFNMGDFIGKLIIMIKQFYPPKKLYILCSVRIIFVVLLFCPMIFPD